MYKRKLNVLRVTKYRKRKRINLAFGSNPQYSSVNAPATEDVHEILSAGSFLGDHIRSIQNEHTPQGEDCSVDASGTEYVNESLSDAGSFFGEHIGSIHNEHITQEEDCGLLIDKEDDFESDNYYSVDEGDVSESNLNVSKKTSGGYSQDFDEEIELRKWIIECRVAQTHGDKLLHILRYRLLPNLPKNCKTFLKTCDEKYVVEKMGQGEFVYFGIEKGLQNLNIDLHKHTIELLINIDGVPAYKSSTRQMWPILGKIYHEHNIYEPFPIAIYYGDDKPKDMNAFLGKFVEEINILNEAVEIDGQHYKLRIKAFCCDTPARALLKGTKGHLGFFSCERCTIKGDRLDNRTIFPYAEQKKRTDKSFRYRKQPEHHTSSTPLLNITPRINMIKCFILDFMHLCCLGVMKKLLEYWLETFPFRLSAKQRRVLEDRTKNMATQVPVEFQRKTRSLKHFLKFKATEFRFFLLYSGPILMRKVLKTSYYRHFLLLHCSCRLLCSDEALTYCKRAKKYLKKFVKNSSNLYGKTSFTKNMHNLLHMTEDVQNMGCSLSQITCFPFENFLGKLKKMIRSGKHVLAQISRRLYEQSFLTLKKGELPPILVILKEKRNNDCFDIQELRYKGFTLRTNYPNNHVLLNDGTCYAIEKLWRQSNCDDVQILARKLKLNGPLFTYPFNSSYVHMWKLHNEMSASVISKPILEIKQKLVTLFIQDDEKQIKLFTMPLLHSGEQ